MKIYPSKHKIKSIPQSRVDTDLNIPLAYIDMDFTKYKIEKNIDNKFSNNKKNLIEPEEEFENKNFKVFNEFEEEVKNDNLFLFKNNKYIYSPTNMIKFSPKKFEWKATIKKELDYKISNNYNLNICAINNDSLNQNLINTFMNPSDRNMLIYKNIKINNNATSYNTFTNVNLKDMDIAFIKTHNCKHYDVNNSLEINITEFLENHTNIWFGCEDAVALKNDYKVLIASTPTTFKISNPIISENAYITTKYYFDLKTINPPTGVKIHNIFNTSLVPFLILEYDKLGFIIISNYEVLDNPLNYESIMYETMMYVYLHTYKSTEWNKEWITYKIPDYEIINGKLTNKTSFLSTYSINSLLNISDANIKLSKLDIRNDSSERIVIDDSDLNNTVDSIKCIGQNNGKLIFILDESIKIDGYVEMEKPPGWKSIYKNGYIYYLEKFHFLLESNITDKVLLLESDNNLIVKIYNFKSSGCNINKQTDTTIEISFIKTDDGNTQRIKEAEYTFSIKDNKINYCYSDEYKEEADKHKLFNVIVGQTDEAITVYDMRQLGGGLPEEKDDNFELFDIGHINGRPYRVAGALVLTMPTKYKPYESYIKKALDKFKTAEDYIAIIFKDDEEENNE